MNDAVDSQRRSLLCAAAITAVAISAGERGFRLIGAGLGGGSGWVMPGFKTHTHQLENYWLADHAHGPARGL